jgi:hypothetical protein
MSDNAQIIRLVFAINLPICLPVQTKFLQLFYTRRSHLYTDLIFISLLCAVCFTTGSEQMDWLYVLLLIAIFGLSDLLIRGIEKLRGQK